MRCETLLIGRIFIKFDILVFFEILSRNFRFQNKGYFTFSITSRSVLLRIKNVSDERCRDSQNTHFVFNTSFSKIVLFMRYVEKYCTAGQVIWRMHIVC